MGGSLNRRQARLRREYASWYPAIQVTGWFPAAMLARKVARQLLEGEPAGAPRWEPGPRLLDDRHFMFRRGERGSRALRMGDTDMEGMLMLRRERSSSTMVEHAPATLKSSPSQ